MDPDRGELSKEFAGLNYKLDDLETRFNPKGLNLHFGTPKDAEIWPGLWDEIDGLAGQGLSLVNAHRDYFIRQDTPSRMYDDGMYWYKLFLFIYAVSIAQLHNENPGATPTPGTQESILDSLIDISEYTSVVPGDIYKRNQEALAQFLLAFPDLSGNASQRLKEFRKPWKGSDT